MAWIESHEELGQHPKTKRLARALQVNLPTAVGHLQFLWWWALKYAQDGDLSKYTDEDIADAIGWEGDPEQAFSALIKSGFIDRLDDGMHIIHDWHEYAGRLIEQRKAQVEYKQRQYALYNDLRLTRAAKQRDGDICQYCGKTVNWNDRRGGDGGTYNLINPSGENTLDNIVVSCRSCNLKKGERTPEEAEMPFVFGGFTLVADVDTSSIGSFSVDTRQVQVDVRQIQVDSQQERSVITQHNHTQPNTTQPYTTEQEINTSLPPANGGEDEEAAIPRTGPVPYKKIIELYNTICIRLRKINTIDGERKKAVTARFKKYGMDAFITLFEKANASDFLCGTNQRNWMADFDWLMNVTNIAKVLEDKYINQPIIQPTPPVQSRPPTNSNGVDTMGVLNRIIEESEGVNGYDNSE